MSKYHVEQDITLCIGCLACEAACKDKNNVPKGAHFCKMIAVGPKMVRNIPVVNYVYMACFHCEKPWCVDACPTGAMQKREKDGIVFVDAELCVGCKACIKACPWGVPQWDSNTGKVAKCDLCKDRIDQGLKPACVTKCTTGALQFGTPQEASEKKRRDFAEQMVKNA
ncbi:MAG: 4Fe-4S dicluster domain-containing protein [Thermodesulfobacteria bacterium]|nr:4Fe-4S dicluster domain-containing protein [Thermodesulfobacteriota bacterium]